MNERDVDDAIQQNRLRVRDGLTELQIDLILDIVGSTPVAVWAARGSVGNYEVALWSPGATKLYGYEPEEILGRSYLDLFVNPLERNQAVQDHKALEEGRQPYRNLARDLRKDRTTRLLLTQGIALWHPALGEYLQGEITVDATEVPGKDRDWLEQVLTPEATRTLLDGFLELNGAAIRSVDEVMTTANSLVRLFLGETASIELYLRAGAGSPLAAAAGEPPHSSCEFSALDVVRWCLQQRREFLIVDYEEMKPPRSGARTQFPRPQKGTPARRERAAFAVRLIEDDTASGTGGLFLTVAPGVRFSDLTESVLSAIAGAVRLALDQMEQIRQVQRESTIAMKERERQATARLARQYRHAVIKKANLLGLNAQLLSEQPANAERNLQIASSLTKLASRLSHSGEDFNTSFEEELVDLGEVLSAVTGPIYDDYPSVSVDRDLPEGIAIKGVRPFLEGSFENILLNAVEAMDYGGRLGVWCGQPRTGKGQRPAAVVYICDDGPGVPLEILEDWHVEGVTTKGPNRGYGLSIASQTFTELGGTMELVLPGLAGWRGACWRITLPIGNAR